MHSAHKRVSDFRDNQEGGEKDPADGEHRRFYCPTLKRLKNGYDHDNKGKVRFYSRRGLCQLLFYTNFSSW